MTDPFSRRIYMTLAEGRDLSAGDEAHLATCAACQAAATRAREFERAFHGELADFRTPMPADPFAVAEIRRGSAVFVPGLAVGLVALVVGLTGVSLLAAPGPEPSPDPSLAPTASPSSLAPSPTETPQLAPSPPPSASPEPTAEEAVRPGDYAVSTADELAVYDRPDGTSFAVVQPGSDLFVIRVQDGWAEVQAQQMLSYEYVFGWVQVAMLNHRDPTPCLVSEPGAPVWFGNVSHPQRDLECHGTTGQLVARGYAIDRTGDPPGPYDGQPSWLAGPAPLDLSGAIGPAVTVVWSYLHVPPDLEGEIPTSDREGFDGVLLEVTGHFNDPRSGGCSLTAVADGHPPVDPRNAELWCRQRFVVDAVEVIEPGG